MAKQTYREKINVVLSLWIPDRGAGSAGKDNWEWVIVVCRKLVLSVDSGFGRGGVEVVLGWGTLDRGGIVGVWSHSDIDTTKKRVYR